MSIHPSTTIETGTQDPRPRRLVGFALFRLVPVAHATGHMSGHHLAAPAADPDLESALLELAPSGSAVSLVAPGACLVVIDGLGDAQGITEAAERLAAEVAAYLGAHEQDLRVRMNVVVHSVR